MLKIRDLTQRLCPLYRAQPKCNLFSVVPAAIAGGVSLLGSVLGVNSQSNTNKASIRLAREQNEFNRAQWERERDFALSMWSKTNQYNSPAEQMKRYKEAGLNPYLMMKPGDDGGASAISAPSGHPAASANLTAPDYSGIGQAGQSAVQAYLDASRAGIEKRMADANIANIDANIANVQEQTLFNQLSRGIRLQDLEEQLGIHSYQHSNERIDYRQKFELMPYVFREMRNRVKEQEANITYTQANTLLAGIQAELANTNQKIALKQFEEMPIRLKYDIAVSTAQILAYKASAYQSTMSGDYTNSQRNEFERDSPLRRTQLIIGNIKNMADAYGVFLSNETAEAIGRVTAKQAELDLDYLNVTSNNDTKRGMRRFLNVFKEYNPFGNVPNFIKTIPK